MFYIFSITDTVLFIKSIIHAFLLIIKLWLYQVLTQNAHNGFLIIQPGIAKRSGSHLVLNFTESLKDSKNIFLWGMR